MRGVALSALAVAALVCWPGAALGASQQYNGPTAAGANAGVEFGARLARGRPVAVRRFSWFNLPAQCKGSSPTATSDMLGITMRVSAKRAFHGTASFNGGRASVTVAGTFTRNFKQATGTIRVQGTITGCQAADSGSVHWTAPAVGH